MSIFNISLMVLFQRKKKYWKYRIIHLLHLSLEDISLLQDDVSHWNSLWYSPTFTIHTLKTTFYSLLYNYFLPGRHLFATGYIVSVDLLAFKIPFIFTLPWGWHPNHGGNIEIHICFNYSIIFCHLLLNFVERYLLFLLYFITVYSCLLLFW